MARVLPDGDLVYVGRRDDRVKVGGIRVEPGEIESALRALPAIDAAVVLPLEDVPGEPVLAAYFTVQPGTAVPGTAALRAALATQLPAALIPARFVACDELPRLPNGKVDRLALASVGAPLGATPLPLETRGLDSRGKGVAPEGAPTGADTVEATLRDIWQALLKRDAVGLDEDFFLLGGHSLLATRLVARIRDRLGVELPLIRVFEAPTIRGLARFLRPEGIRNPAPDDYSRGDGPSGHSPTA